MDKKDLTSILISKGISVTGSKIRKEDLEKAISIASGTPEIKGSWDANDFRSLPISSTLRFRLLSEVVDLARAHPNGKLLKGKNGNIELIVFVDNAGNMESYSPELKRLIKA